MEVNKKLNPIEKAWIMHPEAREEFVNTLINLYGDILEYMYLKRCIQKEWEKNAGKNSTPVSD